MDYRSAVREFKELYKDLYIRHVDYWTGQLAWTEFVDSLNREGRITDKQFNTWETPFKYGKHLTLR